jgi:hypothetical protein
MRKRNAYLVFPLVVVSMLAMGVPVESSEPDAQEATLEAGQELRVATDCTTHNEVSLSIQNRGEGLCEASVAAFKDGEQLSEQEFASFAGSTFEVERNRKNIVGFDCAMDEFVVSFVVGKAEVRVTQVYFEDPAP